MSTKKIGVGTFTTVITAVVTIVALIMYIMNCNTNYFSNIGISGTVVACMVIALVLELFMVVLSLIMGEKPILDIMPVASGIFTAVAAIQFIGSRIAGIASIMTFENNAENMADLENAIVAMVVSVIALVFAMATSFFRVASEKKS